MNKAGNVTNHVFVVRCTIQDRYTAQRRNKRVQGGLYLNFCFLRNALYWLRDQKVTVGREDPECLICDIVVAAEQPHV